MLRKLLIEKVPQFIAWMNKNQKINPKTKPVMINLGSGLTVYRGWYNVDANINILMSKFPETFIRFYHKKSGAKNWFSEDEFVNILKNNTFVHHRMEYGIPFYDKTVDYVYSSHFLEHLFREDALQILKESYRVLKPGGMVRVCVPDLEFALKLYYSGEKERSLKYFFADSRADYTSRHQYMYDYELLKRSLESVGFTDVTKCSFRTGKTPDIEKLDCREEETLYVEAVKPT
jgi:predicted SAM-dependent methyltransferase